MRTEDFERFANVVRRPLLLLSPAGEILAANSAARRLTGRVAAGRHLRDVLAEPVGDLESKLSMWLRHGGPVPARLDIATGGQQLRHRADVGRLALSEGPALLVCLHASNEENRFARVTDQLQAAQREARHRRQAEQHHQAALSAERRSRMQLERLQTLTSALARAATVDDTVEAILANGPAVAEAEQVVVALADESGELELRPPRGAVLGVTARDRWLAEERQPLRDALLRGEALFFASPDELLAAYPLLRRPERDEPAPYLAAAVPMASSTGAQPIGVLGLVAASTPGTEGFGADRQIASGIVAAHCAQSLDRARLYDAERRFAETLQRAMLPTRLPRTKGIDCAVRYLPAAERRAVGGDWYAVVALAGGKTGLAVGDVAGHGPSAATAMASMRNGLRALATIEDSPAAVLDSFNTFVCDQLPDEMATVAYLVADPEEGTLTYANAGHLPPLVVPPGGAPPAFLEEALQPPVGVSADTRYTEATVALDSRCHVVLYTDGLVERRSEDIDLGLERLRTACGDEDGDPELRCDRLLDSLLASQPLTDDVAVLVARIVRERESAATGPAAGAGDQAATQHQEEGQWHPLPCRHDPAPPDPPLANLSRHRRARRGRDGSGSRPAQAPGSGR